MRFETLDANVRKYVIDLQTNYELKIKDLQVKYERQQEEKQEYQNMYLQIKERYDLLVYKRFMRSAEQLPADKSQKLLFAEEEEQTEADEVEEREEAKGEGLTEVSSYTRKKAGRKAIDPNIPREERTVDISEAEKTCACGAELTRVGEESNEKLHIVPPRIYVEKTIRPKYACRKCEGTEDEDRPAVRIAPVEPSIIPRSIASPSLLACIMTQKFEDHLPYYRQEKQFQRIGVTISRQDMASETSFPMAAAGLFKAYAFI